MICRQLFLAFSIFVSGLFVARDVRAQETLIHYWNFNEQDFTAPSFTIGGAELIEDLAQDSDLTTGDGQDFVGENARFGDPAGNHLRLNFPVGSSLTFVVPTTGYGEPVFSYETRRSGSGANTQNVSYTVNGTDYTPVETIEVTETPTLIVIDFADIEDTEDNAVFAVRIEMEQAGDETGGLEGNNRYDNVTVDAAALPGTNLPPEVTLDTHFIEMVAGSGVSEIAFDDLFVDPDGDPLTITAISGNEDVLTVTVAADAVEVRPLQAGESAIEFTASDVEHSEVTTVQRVLVYPSAHDLSEGQFSFAFWSGDEPEGSFPDNMIFLQSDQDDPELDDDLLFAYHIPEDEYHEDDAGNIGFPYRNERRTRINGLGPEGMAMINTGRGRDLGAVVAAVNTEGATGVTIDWVGGTLRTNIRTYNLRPEYRVGHDGGWNPFVTDGFIVEYERNENIGHTESFSMMLPAAALDEPYVQIRWKYYYTGVDADGEGGARDMLRLDNILVSHVLETDTGDDPEVAAEFQLGQNYPNPFNPQTVIHYELPRPSEVRLTVYDMLGREVTILVNGPVTKGRHTVEFDARELSSGTYMYRLEMDDTVLTRKMILMR